MEEQKTVSPPATAGGMNGPLPAELNGWNWGGFLLTWIWGIGNSVWLALLALLAFIPLIGPIILLVVAIMLGLKGNEWAWQHRKFESVEQFKAVQHKWMIWGVILFVIGVIFSIIFLGGLTAFFLHSSK